MFGQWRSVENYYCSGRNQNFIQKRFAISVFLGLMVPIQKPAPSLISHKAPSNSMQSQSYQLLPSFPQNLQGWQSSALRYIYSEFYPKDILLYRYRIHSSKSNLVYLDKSSKLYLHWGTKQDRYYLGKYLHRHLPIRKVAKRWGMIIWTICPRRRK